MQADIGIVGRHTWDLRRSMFGDALQVLLIKSTRLRPSKASEEMIKFSSVIALCRAQTVVVAV